MSFQLKNISILFILLIGLSINISAQTPPTLSATDSLVYCPQEQLKIAPSFTISNPDNEPIESIYLQISGGYDRGPDELILTGTHTNITPKAFNVLEGKLELEWTGPGAIVDSEMVTAVQNVIFENNTTTASGNRTFSITAGQANYLPSTDHYYEYIDSLGISWKDAKIEAESKFYYGRQGYLATITSDEEADLSGEQAAGAGWIGGSDEAIEGTWRWMTGPEAGKSFWIGGVDGTTNGTDIPFAFWNTNEPNDFPDSNVPGQENYAHVTAPGIGQPGSWNDLPNAGSTGDYEPKGYIVEYGATGDSPLNISTSTYIYMPYIDSFTESFNCGTGTVTLSATASSGEVKWFDSATSTIPLYTGETFTTIPISETKIYYAIASESGCTTGERTPITATIRTIPTITTITAPTTICESGSLTLSATASAGIINWYDSVSGGVLLGTGNSFTSPIITDTTAYYVDATENGCTTETREQVIIYVQYTDPPTVVETTQSFCDVENTTLTNLTISGTAILWYENATGGNPLNNDQVLTDNTTYYASQTLSTCESSIRTQVNVEIFETVVPLDPSDIPEIEACDSTNSGDDTDGYSLFDLTQNEAILLNGKNAEDFTFSYFTDPNYLPASEISNPANFENTIENGQPIYIRISNDLDSNCFTDISFEIKVNSLPEIESNVTLKNCDEDGNPDGYTDFNLTEADPFITKGDSNISVTYYLNFDDADQGLLPPLNPSPFNNATASTVYARAENLNGCHRVSTLTLEVSVTSFPPGFNYTIEQCENDDVNDGNVIFDLTEATNYFLSQLPPQNLSVHFFRNSTDAQLSENEILPQDNYINENTPNQTIFVRVQSEDDGGCYGIGPHLTLIVNLRPEFDIEAIPNETVCLNLPPTTLTPRNEKGDYSYEWFNENNESLGIQPTITVSSGGTYSAIATSSFGCESFKQSITLIESNIATISEEDVSITDDSKNNTITISTTNLGIGEYQYALDDNNFQDDPVFENVTAGIHSIFVKDLNGCGTTPPLKVSVIGYPKFFSPNNDGVNDYWQVEGVNSNFYPTAEIYIFNRFGKLITKINPNSRGWDGTFNSEVLPADDYWFTVHLEDNEGVIREKKGHFSLIR